MLQLFDCDFLSVGNLLNEFGANQLRSVEISNQVRNNWQLFDNSIASRKWIQLKSYPQLSAVYPHTCSQSSLQISSLDLVSQNNLAGGKRGAIAPSLKKSQTSFLFFVKSPDTWSKLQRTGKESTCLTRVDLSRRKKKKMPLSFRL